MFNIEGSEFETPEMEFITVDGIGDHEVRVDATVDVSPAPTLTIGNVLEVLPKKKDGKQGTGYLRILKK